MKQAKRVCCATLLWMVPTLLIASSLNSVMLYVQGKVSLSGVAVPQSSVAFVGDSLTTARESTARIVTRGSSAIVAEQSRVVLESNAIALEAGQVTIATSRLMSVRVGNVIVLPSSTVWSQFLVKNDDEALVIVAQKGRLNIKENKGTTTLEQGQQATRFADRGKNRGGATAAGQGGILDSPWVMLGGGAAVGGTEAWILSQGGQPFSPSKP